MHVMERLSSRETGEMGGKIGKSGSGIRESGTNERPPEVDFANFKFPLRTITSQATRWTHTSTGVNPSALFFVSNTYYLAYVGLHAPAGSL